MMQPNVKPGDVGKKKNKCLIIFLLVLNIIVLIILYPFFLVLYCPIMSMYGAGVAGRNAGGCVGAIIYGFFGFIIGCFINICFIPAFLIVTLIALCYGIYKLFICIANGCTCYTDS